MPRTGKHRIWRCSQCEAASRATKCPAKLCFYVLCCRRCTVNHIAYNHRALYIDMGRPLVDHCDCVRKYGRALDHAKSKLARRGKKDEEFNARDIDDAVAELRRNLIAGIPARIVARGDLDIEDAPD